MKLRTFEDLRIEEELCEKLDLEVYLPVKKELEGIGRTYSLGMRKEDFKGIIEKKFEELRQEAIKELKMIDHPIKSRDIVQILGLYNLCKTQDEIENCLFGIRRFLIWKFNLTEEDLK